MLKVANVFTGDVSFGGVKKKLTFFDVLEDVKDEVSFDTMHHIHMLDRSGSMSPHIDDLIEDVKKTLEVIDPEDYVSVLWFSGANQYRTVLKGVKAKDKDGICKILDTLKSTVGCTCFSDPLKELNQIVDETASMCSAFNVTLFTDGEPVTPWSEYEEIQRIFQNLEVVKNKIVALNAIGYGNYYNRDLLLRMVKTTEYGVLSHAKEITDYHTIFSKNKAVVESVAGKRMKISVCWSNAADVVGLTTKTVKFGGNDFSVRLAKTRNKYMVVCDGKDTPSIYVNDEEVRSDDYYGCVRGLITENADILYAYAYKLFEENRRKESIDVLNFLGDKDLFNKQLNTFTNEEVGQHLEDYKELIFSKEFKGLLSVGPGECAPDENAYCVLDLIQDLVDDKALYEPVPDYQRISRKKIDEFNLFERDDVGNLTEMEGLVVGQNRLNVSIRFAIPGKVKINPIRAKAVSLPNEVPACIYRNHAIIKDGGLNIKTMRVIVSNSLYEKFYNLFNEKGIAFVKIVNTLIEKEEIKFVLDLLLDRLPVINSSYLANATAENFFNLESMMLDIEAQNKFINTIITEEDKFETKVKTDYTPEQIAVLIEHGMKTPGVYNSINAVQQEVEDYILTREFRTMIKGFSSLPAFAKVHEKQIAKKKLTAGEALLAKYEDALKDSKKESLLSLRKVNKKTLREIRFKLAGMKLATVLTGNFVTGLEKQDDGSYTYTKGDRTLVAKFERKQVAI